MNLFYIFDFTILQDFLRNQQKQPAFFETFTGGFILLELEMISFLPIILKLFFRDGFGHYLRNFSRFFPFVKSRNKSQWHFTFLTIIRKCFLINAAFIPIYSSCLWVVFSIASRPTILFSLSILRESVLFHSITCISFCTEINNA